MSKLGIILLIIFTAGLNNLFFTGVVKCDDGFFKYLLKTTFCLILSVTTVVCTAIFIVVLANIVKIIVI